MGEGRRKMRDRESLADSLLSAQSPVWGSNSNHEIMTWAEVGRLTDRATQAPLGKLVLKLNSILLRSSFKWCVPNSWLAYSILLLQTRPQWIILNFRHFPHVKVHPGRSFSRRETAESWAYAFVILRDIVRLPSISVLFFVLVFYFTFSLEIYKCPLLYYILNSVLSTFWIFV